MKRAKYCLLKSIVVITLLLGTSLVYAQSCAPTKAGGIIWPNPGNIVISNATVVPEGLAPVDGDCVIGIGGQWTAGLCGTTSTAISFLPGGVILGGYTGGLTSTTTAANSALISSSTGTAAWSQTLPLAVQGNITKLGTVTTGIWNSTALDPVYGGTGITSTPGNNQILIGDGSGYLLSTLTGGGGISVTTSGSTTSISATTSVNIGVAGQAAYYTTSSEVSGSSTLGLTSTSAAVTGTLSTTGGLLGTTTADDACAGCVGEYISSSVANPGTSISSGAQTSIASISLTPGDWDVTVVCYFIGASTTTISSIVTSLSSTNNTLDITPGKYAQLTNFGGTGVISAGGESTTLTIPSYRISLAGTTTQYLIANAQFGTDTLSAWGIIYARRIR